MNADRFQNGDSGLVLGVFISVHLRRSAAKRFPEIHTGFVLPCNRMGSHQTVRDQDHLSLKSLVPARLRGVVPAFFPVFILLLVFCAPARCQKPRTLSSDEITIRQALVRHTHKLSADIGERNIAHYRSLAAARGYIED